LFSFSSLAASIARLQANKADILNTKGGSPIHFEPRIPTGFGLFSKNETRKSAGISFDNGG
jgi:hypothetical protein